MLRIWYSQLCATKQQRANTFIGSYCYIHFLSLTLNLKSSNIRWKNGRFRGGSLTYILPEFVATMEDIYLPVKSTMKNIIFWVKQILDNLYSYMIFFFLLTTKIFLPHSVYICEMIMRRVVDLILARVYNESIVEKKYK